MESAMPHEQQQTNIKVIYEYTQQAYKDMKDNGTKLDNRLSSFIAFSGVLLKFGLDLPPTHQMAVDNRIYWLYWSCLILKGAVCLLSASAIGLCGWALKAKATGIVVDARELLDEEWSTGVDEKTCRTYIADTWVKAIEEIEKKTFMKARYLNTAILFLSLASICFAIDAMSSLFLVGKA
jgi:hypothetical protein